MTTLPRLVFIEGDTLFLEANTENSRQLVGKKRWLIRAPRTWGEVKVRSQLRKVLLPGLLESEEEWELSVRFPSEIFSPALSCATRSRAEWFADPILSQVAQRALAEVEEARLRGVEVFPPPSKVFTAFDLTPYSKVRVLLLGQDPYHGPGQATGLAFSIDRGWLPPSLANILRELESDQGPIASPALRSGNLREWAENGVLLLNTALTVEAKTPESHLGIWRPFTLRLLEVLNEKLDFAVLLLWGAKAVELARGMSSRKFPRVTTSHPSPLSAHRGFLGSRCFSEVNTLLEKGGVEKINWTRKGL